MRIAIIHNEVGENSRKDEQDILVQAGAISKALEELGYKVFQFPCGLDLFKIKEKLEGLRPDLVFNLVESLGGEDRLIYLFPALLDAIRIPYTGSCTESIFITSHKILAKERMCLARLSTPAWIEPYPFDIQALYHTRTDIPFKESQWILKSLHNHGSLGLEGNNIISGKTEEEIKDLIKSSADDLGGSSFAELFIHGREFNLSILGSPAGPVVLPPAEIIFEGFEEGNFPIVGYRAKWDAESYEYSHTNRSFDFTDDDQSLLAILKTLALRCWDLFGLKGYARIDFRVDENKQPWILEVNCNPCLSPDAGFVAAALRSGLSYKDMTEKIINEVYSLHERQYAQNEQEELFQDIKLRYEVIPEDLEAIRRLAEATGFFYSVEVDVAEELVRERIEKGNNSGYYFILAEYMGRLAGYSCYGPIACTASSFDIYWIVVNPELQGRGFGKRLLKETERLVRAAKGERIYVETSQRPLYKSTRAFYENNGYKADSLLENFYGPGDGKVTYCKVLI
jgi:D-alanine-D-alanine ligase